MTLENIAGYTIIAFAVIAFVFWLPFAVFNTRRKFPLEIPQRISVLYQRKDECRVKYINTKSEDERTIIAMENTCLTMRINQLNWVIE